jgi:hypothetical protein
MARSVAVLVAGAVVSVAAVLIGAWWAPFPVGIAIGLVERRARIAIPIAAGVGLLAWLFPLVQAQFSYGIGSTAGALAALLGFDHQGAVPIILTLVVGALLGLIGAWVSTALKEAVAEVR